MKRLISVVLSATIFSSLLVGTIIAEPTASDLNKAAFTWAEKSVLSKEDWIVNSNDPVQRAEFAVVIDNIMKLQGKSQNSYSDAKEGWYVDYMLKIDKANLLVGSNGKINPFGQLSREDAVVVFAKAIGVKVDFNQKESSFTDNSAITATAVPYIRAMKDMNNLPFQGEFKPKENITKGELLSIIDLSISDIHTDGKTYTDSIENSLIINSPTATLENITINENLIISEGAVNGTITLNNVTVKGQTIIRGSKEIVSTQSNLSTILVENRDNATNIKLDDKSTASSIKVVEAKDGITVQGKITVANLHNAKGTFSLVNGSADRIEAASEGLKVSIDKNSKAKLVNLNATDSSVSLSGSVESVYTGEKANKTGITVLEGGILTTLTKRTDSIVDSKGTITTVIELPAYNPPKPKAIAATSSDTASASVETGAFLGTFTSTAYCVENYHHICNNGNPSKTAMGTRPIPYKTIAVDPRVIKLGTKLKLQDSSGKVYYVTATDTGGAIKGKKIDMVVDSHNGALNWGRRSVKIWKVS